MRIAIIGAGAAGCFAAANIPYEKGREVVVFEKASKILQKVKVSGGGRCNVTTSCFDIPELLKKYPRGSRFLKKTLYRFPPNHTVDWFNANGVELKTEEDGRIFPVTDNSQTIIDCLWQQIQKNRVQLRLGKSVSRIDSIENEINIHFADGSSYAADKVLIATGGFPKVEQYKWLIDLGHTVEAPVPSLFTFNMPKHPITELMGVSVPKVSIKIQGTKINEEGPILITHWGLSGPVVLRCSAWGAQKLHELGYSFTIFVNWLQNVKDEELKIEFSSLRQEQGKQLVHSRNPFGLPKRLWSFFIKECGVTEETRWGDLPAKSQNKLINKLVQDQYQINGKTTFKEEFVTAGGIKLKEVEPLTMESRVVNGLYFAGEILNIDGITGGFNFQHAWSSGYIAAQSMIEQDK